MTIAKEWACVLAAAVVLGALLWGHDAVIGWLADDTIQLDNLYNAVFGWSSIQTGFLFTVYGFITGKRDGFVGAILHTQAMRFFKRSLGWAIIVGFLLTLLSMPLIAIPVEPTSFDKWYISIALWFAFFVWSFLLFCKVAFNFGVIARVPDNQDRPAH